MFNFNLAFCILGKTGQSNGGLAISLKEGEEVEKNKPRVTYSKVTSCVLNLSK